MNPSRVNLIGLIPAAGRATRFLSLPKYLFPVGNGFLLNILCDRLYAGGAGHLFIGANSDNRHILKQYAPRAASVFTVATQTMSETVLAAYTVGGVDRACPTLFGMPDSYWQDETIYPRLAGALDAGATVAAALFQTRPGQHRNVGMVEAAFYGEDLLVKRVVDKPDTSDLSLCWGALAWSHDFWQYIKPTDPHVGFAMQRAIEHHVTVHGVLATGDYWDVGTPEGYYECIRAVSGVKV